MSNMRQILNKMSASEKKQFAMMISVMIIAVALLGGCDYMDASPGTLTRDPIYRETPTRVASSTDVYVSRTPTPKATRTLTRTPTVVSDTATTRATAIPTKTERPDEVVWGSVNLAQMSNLSSESMEELATQLGYGNYFVQEGYDYTFPERDREITGISSGNVLSIVVNDMSTGNNLGVVDAAEFVSRGHNGQAFSFWTVLQTRLAGYLTTDLRSDLTRYFFRDYENTSTDAYTLPELRGFLDQNLILRFGFSSGGCVSRIPDPEERICRAMYSTVKGYPDLLAELGFSDGSRNDVLVYPTDGHN